MRSTEPGQLTSDEVALLERLLSQLFTGVEPLRQQVGRVLAKQGCGCGCGTIAFAQLDANLPRSTASSPVPAEGEVPDASGAVIGGLLLFLDEGLLSSLEVYAYGDPIPLPTLDRVRWSMVNR